MVRRAILGASNVLASATSINAGQAIGRLVEIRAEEQNEVSNWTSNTRVLVCIIAALLFTLWFALWLQYY
jgi:hypothetical protein